MLVKVTVSVWVPWVRVRQLELIDKVLVVAAVGAKLPLVGLLIVSQILVLVACQLMVVHLCFEAYKDGSHWGSGRP